MLVRFIKNWTLPLAMLAGTLGYFFFADIPFVAPAKPYVNGLVAFLTPLLIFSQLLLTFCKVEVHELKPKSWHGWLLLFQTVSCLIVAVLLVCCPMEEVYREVFEGAMVCLICPTATAAWKRIQPDDLYVVVQSSGGCGCSFGFPVGGASC